MATLSDMTSAFSKDATFFECYPRFFFFFNLGVFFLVTMVPIPQSSADVSDLLGWPPLLYHKSLFVVNLHVFTLHLHYPPKVTSIVGKHCLGGKAPK